ncbi:MAG TPA: hypothetical protein VGM88_21075 [Kofleriaceae bacterium]|jgi:hypothetical protein
MYKLTVLALLAAACGTPSEAAPAGAAKVDVKAACVQMYQRERSCTDDFIPKLVDARARTDNPKGIKAEVAKDRNATIAEAKKEWAEDSKDAAIEARCAKDAPMMEALPQAEKDAGVACFKKADCAGFDTCIVGILEKHFAGH